MSLVVAVTGASGFVGQHVVPQLFLAGFQVRALMRNEKQASAGAESIIGDLHNQASLDQLCNGADVVLHMAGAINALSTDEFMRVNATGTANVVAAATRNGVRRVVYLSSLAAREPTISSYAASKHAGELHVKAAQNCETLILRPAAVYGEGDKATLPLLQALMSWLAIIPGKVDSNFSMIHVSDLADVCKQSVTSSYVGMLEIDDNGGGHHWRDVIAASRKAFGYPKYVIFLPKIFAFGIGALADAWSKFRGKPSMVSLAKMRELYAKDWVVHGQGWLLSNPIVLEAGLKRTLVWNMAAGALPQRMPADRSAAPQTDVKL